MRATELRPGGEATHLVLGATQLRPPPGPAPAPPGWLSPQCPWRANFPGELGAGTHQPHSLRPSPAPYLERLWLRPRGPRAHGHVLQAARNIQALRRSLRPLLRRCHSRKTLFLLSRGHFLSSRGAGHLDDFEPRRGCWESRVVRLRCLLGVVVFLSPFTSGL